MGIAYNPKVITDGLVLALDAQNSKSWKSGTTWTDTIGGNNGTLTGGTSHSDGPFPEAGYVEFDGSTEYLSIADSADLDFDTGDFTCEAWVYVSGDGTVGAGSPNGRYFYSKKSNSTFASTDWVMFYDISTDNFNFTCGISGALRLSSSVVEQNRWYHVATTRESGTVRLFVDGVLQDSGTFSGSLSNSNNLLIGFNQGSNNAYFEGFVSNSRIVKGTALYTSDFTPPSSPLTAVTNTTLLCCQGATNVDASPSAHSFQVIIGVPTLTSVGPSATKYFEFDGTNDAVDVGNVNPTSGATFSAWININGANTNYGGIFNRWGAGGNSFWIGTKINQSSTIQVFFNGSLIHDITSLALNTWMLLTVSHTGSNATSYINGIQKNTNSASLISSTGTTSIGYDINRTNYPFKGNIAQVSIYNRALTAAEVQQNYNALKGRYGF